MDMQFHMDMYDPNAAVISAMKFINTIQHGTLYECIPDAIHLKSEYTGNVKEFHYRSVDSRSPDADWVKVNYENGDLGVILRVNFILDKNYN